MTALLAVWNAGGGLAGFARMTAAAAVAIAFTLLWAFLVIVPDVREQTRTVVAAQLEANFRKATGELQNEADRHRLRRRLCLDGGQMYDFTTGDCAEKRSGRIAPAGSSARR